MAPSVVDQHEWEAGAPLRDCTSSIRIGSRVGSDFSICLWKPGSTLTFSVDSKSFHTCSSAEFAIARLEAAAHLWNEGNVGIRFEKVANDESASFRLVYRDQPRDEGEEKTLADAFFPRKYRQQPRLIVYPAGLSCSRYLTNIFCHELGHVLGLRHEFREESSPSLRCGKRNAGSVMNYFDHPSLNKIHDWDIEDVKQFYAHESSHYMGFKITTFDPKEFPPSSQ